MNKTKKNIVIVGFNESESRSIELPLIGKNYYINDMKEASKHQGYLIIINNNDNIDIVSFDKKYRKILNKYEYIWLYNEKYKNKYYKFSRINLINRELFEYDCLSLWDEYDQYKYSVENNRVKNYSAKRINNINKIYNYLKDYKIIKTKKISKDLNINIRNIQRYMKDINDIYHNIGYDYSNNEWYIIW